MDPVFYNSGDPEFKNPLGLLIYQNTISCNGYYFSYSTNIVAQRITDNTNVLITNFSTPVNGAITSGDYLSIFTTNYKDSPYIVNVVITTTLPDKLSIM